MITKKILCDSELYITIGGSYSTDVCGNSICLFKITNDGIINYVSNSRKFLNNITPYNDGTIEDYSQNNSVNLILYSFINNIFGDIIVSYYIYGNFMNYINNCNFIKLDKNLVYTENESPDEATILKIIHGGSIVYIPIVSIPNILIDLNNNIYNIFYNMANYPNDQLYSIAFNSSYDNTFYIYKDTFRLSNLTQNLIPILTYKK